MAASNRKTAGPDAGAAVILRAREARDLEAVRALLEAAGLTTQGLERTEGWVVEEGGRVIGHVALERAAAAALLRSLAVAPGDRERGLGGRLLDLAEHAAGPRILVLRTRTIGPWAERRGYRLAGAGQVPADIMATTEFEGTLCCACPTYVKPPR